ncbi:MAG: DUF349 domain-containing protein [Pseudomonadota bacterium]
MFEFLFKRPGDAPGETMPAATASGAPGEQAASPRAQQAERAAGLGGDEAQAVAFILQCEFSELRLAAAEHVHSRAALEQVHGAIRNTDRRVAKLMQSRLDAIRHHQSELQRGQACLDQARTLLSDVILTPNHVADLDRKWSVVHAPELGAEFDALRTALAQRLEHQMALQRAMIDSLAALRQLGARALPAGELADILERMGRAHAQALAAPEHETLPRSLVAEFGAEHARLSASLETLARSQSAAGARAQALAEWEAADPATLGADSLKVGWQRLGAPSEAEQQRFEALLAARPPAAMKAAPRARPARPEAAPEQHLIEALDAMEAALQQGSLASAAEHDKVLKEAKGVRLGAARSERLAHARAELKRLSDWARWGGNVSREELIKAVEALPEQKLAMSELAKKVGSMRERWKGLDTLSGSAPKSLWERFDSACSNAYAPAAAHFKHLADERHANAARAQQLIADAQAEAARNADSVDWKHVAQAVQRLRLAWSHLGAIDRKDKKRLDHEFGAVLGILQGPLEGQRQSEIGSREDLIAQVAALNSQDRHALDSLRQLQEAWQQHARALPLERKAEQALWQRFRAACDAVFAKRKENAHAADAERRAHQGAKEAICARLEAQAATVDGPGAGKLLREAATEWHAIGAVPRASEAKIEKRYHAAIAAVQHQADSAKRHAMAAQASALRDKLRLCQALEAALAGQGADESDWQARWTALPALAADYERALQARFNGALQALSGDPAAYAGMLEQNRGKLLQEVLRLEIAAGVDSGSEFARERLKLQVEVLQSSLKSGQKPLSQGQQYLQLCALAALVDARTASRIEHLFARIGRDGK